MIHPSAILDPGARLERDVKVGPWTTIGPDVEIGSGTEIGSHVVVTGPTRIGRGNRIHAFNVLGGAPQDKKFQDEPSRLQIGDGNVIREFCTFNRGTAGDRNLTRVGDNNWIMAYVHVAHDCVVGNDVVMANGSTLAGHVRVDDGATLGAFTVVHQFCSVGSLSFSAMGSVILKDVPPYITVSGNSASPHGLNSEGLKRRGFDADAIRRLRRAYKIVYRQGNTREGACEALEELARECEHVRRLSDFLHDSRRGIVR